jgi:TPR repeat protein
LQGDKKYFTFVNWVRYSALGEFTHAGELSMNRAILLVLACAFLTVRMFSQSSADEPFASLQKRADAGEAKAQNELGVRYRTGDGVEQDRVKAAELYRLAAKQGYAVAYFNLGTAFYNGDGVITNENAACKWFLLASEEGEPSGKDAYSREKEDPQTRKGTNCQVLAGDAYLKGEEIPKDERRALQMYNAAAQAGNPAADLRLYNLYGHGIAVAKDQATAMHWLQDAANHHDRVALFILGSAYDRGDGVPPDARRACENYKSAAFLGSPDAFVALGTLLRDGRGIAQNLALAYRYYGQAKVMGVSDVQPLLDAVHAQLTKKQLNSLSGSHLALRADEVSCK